MEYTNIHPEIQKTLLKRVDALNKKQKITDALLPRSDSIADKHIDAIIAKSCWVRVHSSIVDGDTGKLFRLSSAFTGTGRSAQPLSAVESKGIGSKISNRLTGKYKGTALTSEPNLFNNDKNSMFRPHAGITSISTQFKTLLIQNTTINWTFYDKEQFSKYEDALMRHGRYVLVEFGWTTPKVFGSPRFENLNDMMSSYRKMRDKVRESGGNYYQTLGKIKNFNYKIGTSGEFKCTTELMSMGNDMFATRIEADPSKASGKVKFDEENVGKAYQQSSVHFANYMKNLDDIIADEAGKGEYGVYYDSQKPAEPPARDIPSFDSGWCSWGWFEDKVLNTFFGLTDKNDLLSPTSNENFEILLSYIRSVFDQKQNFCRTHSKIITLNTDVILPGKITGLKKLSEEAETSSNYEELTKINNLYKNINASFKPWEGSGGGIIRNFVFSSSYLNQFFGGGITTLDSALKSFWESVSGLYGGYWSFKIYQDKDDAGHIGIRDENVLAKDSVTKNTTKNPDNASKKGDTKKNFKFSVYSANSLLKDYDFNIDMSSDMATQAMFHSNKKYGEDGDNSNSEETIAVRALGSLRNTSMVGNANLNKNTKPESDVVLTTPIAIDKMVKIVNNGKNRRINQEANPFVDRSSKPTTFELVDVPTSTKSTLSNVLKDSKKQQEEVDNKLRSEEVIEKYGDGFYDFNTGEDGRVTDLIYDIKGNVLEPFVRTIKAVLNGTMIDIKTGEATVEPLLPMTKVSFGLNGIAGIEPLDLFSVDYLPDVYREKTVFQVTTTSHDISPQGWTTKIEGSMRLSAQLLIEDANSRLVSGDQIKLKKFDENQLKELNSAVNNQYQETSKPNTQQDLSSLTPYSSGLKTYNLGGDN